jgi:hypothetical protein
MDPLTDRRVIHKSDAPAASRPDAGGTMKIAPVVAAVLVLSAFSTITPTSAQTTSPTTTSTSDPRFFSQTGFRIDTDAFWNFFQQRGGVRTFGYPVSRTFTLDGFQVQIFQREVMQLQPDGGVQTLNLLDPGLMPYTSINGSTFPAPDPAVEAATPPVIRLTRRRHCCQGSTSRSGEHPPVNLRTIPTTISSSTSASSAAL